MNQQKYKKLTNRLFYGVIALFTLAVIDIAASSLFENLSNICGAIWLVILALILIYLPVVLIILTVQKKKLQREMTEQRQHA